MQTRRYTALSFLSLLTLILGLAALAAPAPFRGPLVVPMPSQLPLGSPAALAGLTLLRHPIYLADVIGLGLLLVATLAIWVVAIAWELRRLRAR